jgi:hypothetical protein
MNPHVLATITRSVRCKPIIVAASTAASTAERTINGGFADGVWGGMQNRQIKCEIRWVYLRINCTFGLQCATLGFDTTKGRGSRPERVRNRIIPYRTALKLITKVKVILRRDLRPGRRPFSTIFVYHKRSMDAQLNFGQNSTSKHNKKKPHGKRYDRL